MPRSPHRPGYSLVELVVVLAIVGLLAGLTLSAVQQVRAAAARAACGDRLRQLGLAAHGYHGGHAALPPGVSVKADAGSYPYLNWEARLLPYVEQDALWRQAEEAYRLRPDDFTADPHPVAVPVAAFACPADPHAPGPRVWRGGRYAFSSYLGVSGTRRTRHDGVLYVDSRTRLADITDGASNTLLAGERPGTPDAAFGWWYAGAGQHGDGSADSVLSTGERAGSVWFSGCPGSPARFGPGRLDNQCDGLHFWSMHPGGAHFLFCDGAVRFVPYAAADLLPPLATRAGGEPAELP
jgi:prepilin-type N-terminal cleavage/methylation domain-containing protein/prepilin-type processing-associated H-X9-DG protein